MPDLHLSNVRAVLMTSCAHANDTGSEQDVARHVSCFFAEHKNFCNSQHAFRIKRPSWQYSCLQKLHPRLPSQTRGWAERSHFPNARHKFIVVHFPCREQVRTKPEAVDSFLDKGLGSQQLPRKNQDRKDREKQKREKGQSTHKEWKSEAEMAMRQLYD